MEAVKKCEYNFDSEIWTEISPEAKDLIKKLMTASPESRLSASEALEHEWIKNSDCLPEKDLSESHLKMLKCFRTSIKLRQVVLNYIATQLTCKETGVKELNELFLSMDINKDGKLSLEEFKNGLEKVKEPQEIEEIMQAVDVDQSGFIDYTEFIAATMDERLYLQKGKILNAFNTFDKVC
jgi:calcium-dependent protein kinase